MVSDPRAKTSTPCPRRARGRAAGARRPAPGAALGARARAVRAAAWSLPGGDARRGRDARALDPPPPRGQGRRARALPPRAARDPQRARPQPARAGSSRPPTSGSCRATSIPALPADTRWHPVDELPPLAFDHGPIVLAGRERLRAKLSYTNIGFALAPDDVHDLRAARPLPRRARPRRLGDEPPARAAAPPPARPDRQPPRARPGGRPPGGALRLPHARRSRSPTSSRCCGRRARLAALDALDELPRGRAARRRRGRA